jgi:hypothetical protein
MAVKAVNDTAGPDGLVPTLLVYGAYLRMTNLDPPALSIIDRAAVIWKAMSEIAKLWAKQAVSSALNHCNRPDITLVHDLPLNSEVLVWRESGNWAGPYRLLSIEGETCRLQLSSGLTSFCTMSVKPYLRSETTGNDEADEVATLETPTKPTEPTNPVIRRGRGRLRKHPVTEDHLTPGNISVTIPADISIIIQEISFADSRQKEINGLLEKGVFAAVIEKDVLQGVYIFNSCSD